MSKGVGDDYFTGLAHENSKAYFQWGPWNLRFCSFAKDMPALEIDPPNLLLLRTSHRQLHQRGGL